MPNIYNAGAMPQPIAHYQHIAEVQAGGRTLYLAGQTGRQADGTIPDGIAAQTEQAYKNVLGLLDAGGLTAENLVQTTIYMVNREDLDGMHDAQAKVLGDAKPPSTLVFVAGLASPQMLIEVEAIAAED